MRRALARHRVLDWHGASISAAVREQAAITAAAAWSPPPAFAAAWDDVLDHGNVVQINEMLDALRSSLPEAVRLLLALTPAVAMRVQVARALFRGGEWPRRGA